MPGDSDAIGGTLFAAGGPSRADIAQGSVNDCYLVSALGQVAQYSPQTIENMFIDNGDGTYTVRFYHNGAPTYVTVNLVLPVKDSNGEAFYAGWGGYQSFFPGNVLWVALAEKAYVQLNESGWIGQDGTNTYHGIDNGDPSVAFSQITGRSASDHSFSSSSASTVINAFNAGQAIIFATKATGTDATVVADHTYMLTGYDPDTKMFELTNTGRFINYSDNYNVYPMTLELAWADVVRNCLFWSSTLV